MKRVLITGGAGFIGQHLVRILKSRGCAVTVLDNLSPQIHGAAYAAKDAQQALGKDVRFILGDIRDRGIVAGALVDQSAVIHLAAETGTGQSMYEIERYVEVNVRGTAILFELIAQAPVRPNRIVVASSRAIYGEGAAACPQHGMVFPAPRRAQDMAAGKFHLICPECGAACGIHPTAETAPVQPRSVYGQTKLSQEQLTLILGQSLGIEAIALRYQNVYGPGQSLRNPYTGILSIFSSAILEGKPIRIFEDGEESRDFVHVEDAARLTADAIETPICGAFNVGSGESISINEVVSRLAKALGRSANAQVTGEFREGDIRHSAADLTRVRREYGFLPTRGFEEGLKSFATWVETQPPGGSAYLESLVEMRSAGLLKLGPTST